MANLVNTALLGILERVTARDVDYRYIATSDLMDELVNGRFILNRNLERRLIDTVFHLLLDSTDQLSDLAVKCVSPLVNRIQLKYIGELANKLCDELISKREQHRDIACVALKTIFFEASKISIAAVFILSCIFPKLKKGITAPVMNPDIKCACLDILCEALNKCGNQIEYHVLVLNVLLPQLSFCRSSVRKKTVSCIASLATSLSDNLLEKATVEVVNLLRNTVKPEIARTSVQMIGALCHSVGDRFGTYLRLTIPVLKSYCISESENSEELRECILQAMESFLLVCSRDVSSYCEEILHLTLKLLSYDPDFDDNMEEDTEDEIYQEEEDDESNYGFMDDEDVSWKVRRAAAKCLATLIISRPEMLPMLFVEACPKLIDRFREREEVVKMDVFKTFIELLRQTGNATNGQNESHGSSPKWLLKQEVPKIVKYVKMQLQGISVKTKVAAFSVLKELAVVLPDCVADNFRFLIPEIENALCDNSSTSDLKLEALILTRLVLASSSPTVFYPYIEAISRPALSAVRDSFYKVSAEALRVCGEIICIVRPNTEGCNFDFEPYVYPIYNAIMERLTNQDQDQEVKKCAIFCMGLVVSTFGDNLGVELPACLPILANRMGNEITRLAAVKAFAVIAASPVHLDLSCVLEHVIAELTAFLRKDNPALREATLETLNTLVQGYGDKISSTSFEVILAELSSLIRYPDLHISTLALKLSSTVKLFENVKGQKWKEEQVDSKNQQGK
ncbi:Cullin-associated NEDD8-dissociated protein 1 [Heracleum sosnowskyi]|uniref:Cullin-associated NEDD8-dissociated protein 1 n=1 Tax=Heracleum sosnowskyi TaxID=360622 RepID=A0AAD8MS15_9APIA|nr:Cullin-associated NEDD8-dissociated protein 1 [Heracleum sosnowskyi]